MTAPTPGTGRAAGAVTEVSRGVCLLCPWTEAHEPLPSYRLRHGRETRTVTSLNAEEHAAYVHQEQGGHVVEYRCSEYRASLNVPAPAQRGSGTRCETAFYVVHGSMAAEARDPDAAGRMRAGLFEHAAVCVYEDALTKMSHSGQPLLLRPPPPHVHRLMPVLPHWETS